MSFPTDGRCAKKLKKWRWLHSQAPSEFAEFTIWPPTAKTMDRLIGFCNMGAIEIRTPNPGGPLRRLKDRHLEWRRGKRWGEFQRDPIVF